MGKNIKGFTLIELLVVVLIIGILAAIALPQYTKAVEKSRSAEAIINLKAISDAANRFYLSNNTYIGINTGSLIDNLDISLPENTAAGIYVYGLGGIWTNSVILKAERAKNGVIITGDTAYALSFILEEGSITARTCSDGVGGKLCRSLVSVTNASCDGSFVGSTPVSASACTF